MLPPMGVFSQGFVAFAASVIHSIACFQHILNKILNELTVKNMLQPAHSNLKTSNYR